MATSEPSRRRAWGPSALIVLAFALRVAASWPAKGEMPEGYTYYLEMADTMLEGRGMHREMPFGQGDRYAIRGPAYPAFVLAVGGLPFDDGRSIVVFGAFCGALTVAFVILMATQLFGARAGIVAGVVAAFWPYAVAHDGALQDTALYTMLLLVVALLARRIADGGTWKDGALGGLTAAAAVLVRITLLPSVVAVLGLGALALTLRVGARRASIVPLAAMAVLLAGLAPWQSRNARVIGAAVLTSDTGRSLWLGNNPQLFEVYPAQSIDRAEERAWTALPEETRAHVRSLGGDELAQDAWFREQAMSFIRAHPRDAFVGGLRKAWASFSPVINPEGGRFRALAHALSYGPVALLALAAFVRLRARWRELLPFAALIALLALQSAVFFGHSGYRAYLDPFLIVLASSWIAGLRAAMSGRPPAGLSESEAI